MLAEWMAVFCLCDVYRGSVFWLWLWLWLSSGCDGTGTGTAIANRAMFDWGVNANADDITRSRFESIQML